MLELAGSEASQRRARELVLSGVALVGVIVNAGVLSAISTREADKLTLGGSGSARSTNIDLGARDEELGATDVATVLQREDFMAEEVASGLDIAGESDDCWEVLGNCKDVK